MVRMINEPFLAGRSYHPIAGTLLLKSVPAYLTTNVATIEPQLRENEAFYARARRVT